MEKNVSLQQAYEKIREHFIQQGRPAVDMRYESKPCYYRHKDGDVTLMCAVGCLIDDDAYNRSIEDNCVESDVVIAALEKSGLSLSDRGKAFLSDAQMAHDRWDQNDLPWALKKLDEAADRYGLVSA